MKILVFSDSHSGLIFMRKCIDALCPDQIIHLGDHFEDGQAMAQEYPNIRFHQVPGNCDRYLSNPTQADILNYDIAGVRFYISHGHKHGVKSGDHRFVAAAREAGAAVGLYGHTHEASCYRAEDGMWVMNPGSCRGFGGSVGLIEIRDNEIISCRVLRQES